MTGKLVNYPKFKKFKRILLQITFKLFLFWNKQVQIIIRAAALDQLGSSNLNTDHWSSSDGFLKPKYYAEPNHFK